MVKRSRSVDSKWVRVHNFRPAMAKSMDTITCKLQSLEERLQAENDTKHLFENRTAAPAAITTNTSTTANASIIGSGSGSGSGRPHRRPQLTGCKLTKTTTMEWWLSHLIKFFYNSIFST